MKKSERYYLLSAAYARLDELAKLRLAAWMYRDGNTFIVQYVA